MCGIVGLVHRFGLNVVPEAIQAAASLLYKRGPDDSGCWVESSVGLGHRRLAILDLSPAGHQPMTSSDGRYVIVFNGEIYNFLELRRAIAADDSVWQSRSDTEVILGAYAKWGVDCVNHFQGMFAFAIWDRNERVLFAARDRMGVKPFYYHFSDTCFAFASRPRALRVLNSSISSELDNQALRYYLDIGYIPAPLTIHRSIRKLPPAHYILFDEKRRTLKIERYWQFQGIAIENSWRERSEACLLDELDDIVSRCVRSRMVSDVPLGAFLSGGIDSSLVVAMMARHSSASVKTFTIGFEEARFDESHHASAVAKVLGTDHYCDQLRVNDLLELLPTFFEEFDEPFFDSSAFPTMAVSRLAKRHVTVSLSGDGGDELFGGYHYYNIVNRLDMAYHLPSWMRKIGASMVGLIPNHRAKLLAAALVQNDSAAAFAFMRSIAKDYSGVLNKNILCETESFRHLFSRVATEFPTGISSSEAAMRLDALYTLPDDFLQKVDVASMAFSLESRDPLLDHELVEWAMRLPVEWKIRGGVNKYLLRQLAYRYVPREILDRPKRGFEVPLAEWLRGPLHDWALECFNDSRAYKILPIEKIEVLKLFELHMSRRRNVHPLLWAILVLINLINAAG